AAVEPEPVRTRARNKHGSFDLGPVAVDHRDLGWVADVRVDAVALLVVERPTWPARQRQFLDNFERVDVDDRGGAVIADRLAQVEAVEPPPRAVVGEPVRVRPNLDPAQKRLVRAAEDADPGGAAVGGE